MSVKRKPKQFTLDATKVHPCQNRFAVLFKVSGKAPSAPRSSILVCLGISLQYLLRVTIPAEGPSPPEVFMGNGPLQSQELIHCLPRQASSVNRNRPAKQPTTLHDTGLTDTSLGYQRRFFLKAEKKLGVGANASTFLDGGPVTHMHIHTPDTHTHSKRHTFERGGCLFSWGGSRWSLSQASGGRLSLSLRSPKRTENKSLPVYYTNFNIIIFT